MTATNMLQRLKPVTPVEPRAVREHHIEDDEIDLVRRQTLVKLMAACSEQHAEALTLDIAGEQLADLRIVVCDKNSLLSGHRALFSAPAWLQRG